MEAIEEKESATSETMGETMDRPKRSLAWLGTMLILLSGVLFFLMCALPWIYVWGVNKWLVGMVLYVLVQIAWWIGAAMVGPSAIKKIWSFFVPTRKPSELP